MRRFDWGILCGMLVIFRENEGPPPAAIKAVFDSFRILPAAIGTSPK
jgi:hypothetical protein